MESSLSRENMQTRWQRMFAGAFYGLLGGMVFALLGGTVDYLWFRDLPIHILWPDVLTRMAWLGPGLALAGALTGSGTENIRAMLGGAITLSLLALLSSVLQSDLSFSMRLVTVAMLGLPITAACLPLAWLLRWLINRSGKLSSQNAPARLGGNALLILITLAIAITPALFMRMPTAAENSMRFAHARFQAAANDRELAATLPVMHVPDLLARLGQPYTLSYAESKISTVGYDITLWFGDGYAATCVVVAYEGQEPYISICYPGAEIDLSQ